MSETREEEAGEGWSPRTTLGKMVLEGRITSLEEVYDLGLRISEPQIVDRILPRLTEEVVAVDAVQKQTDAGERRRFRTLVVVGDFEGHVGVGVGKARQVRDAIEKGVAEAKLSIIPVRMGCGSWECRCGTPHSIPFKVEGKCGSVRVSIGPGPRGLGLVAGETAKVVLRLAGIRDCWTRSEGQTSTRLSFAIATFDALKKLVTTLTPELWTA